MGMLVNHMVALGTIGNRSKLTQGLSTAILNEIVPVAWKYAPFCQRVCLLVEASGDIDKASSQSYLILVYWTVVSFRQNRKFPVSLILCTYVVKWRAFKKLLLRVLPHLLGRKNSRNCSRSRARVIVAPELRASGPFPAFAFEKIVPKVPSSTGVGSGSCSNSSSSASNLDGAEDDVDDALGRGDHRQHDDSNIATLHFPLLRMLLGRATTDSFGLACSRAYLQSTYIVSGTARASPTRIKPRVIHATTPVTPSEDQ